MNITRYDKRAVASAAAAARLAYAIRTQLNKHRPARIAVSGGSSPRQCYQILSRELLPWESVKVTLTDERCVPEDHPERNARMLRSELLTNQAEAAQLEPIEAQNFEHPFAAVLLGMGEDGHIASIFPDSAVLEEALDIRQAPAHLKITTSASVHLRHTLNLAALLHTNTVILLAFGDAKGELIDQPGNLPVHALLAQQRVPLDIIWAP